MSECRLNDLCGLADSSGGSQKKLLAAVSEAIENKMSAEEQARLQGVRVQPYFVAADLSSWEVPPHFLLCNNPMEFAAQLTDCPSFHNPEVRSE